MEIGAGELTRTSQVEALDVPSVEQVDARPEAHAGRHGDLGGAGG